MKTTRPCVRKRFWDDYKLVHYIWGWESPSLEVYLIPVLPGVGFYHRALAWSSVLHGSDRPPIHTPASWTNATQGACGLSWDP